MEEVQNYLTGHQDALLISMVSVKIENIVASARVSAPLDLGKLEENLIGSNYNPEQFEGLLYKLLKPKAAFLILKNGKAVCTGLKAMEDVKSAYSNLIKLMSNEGIEVKDQEDMNIEIKGIVASTDLAQKIDLETVINILEDDAEFDAEAFPGVIYHLSEPRSTALIFKEGKVIFTGPKSMDDLKTAVDVVLTRLEEGKAIVV